MAGAQAVYQNQGVNVTDPELYGSYTFVLPLVYEQKSPETWTLKAPIYQEMRGLQ